MLTDREAADQWFAKMARQVPLVAGPIDAAAEAEFRQPGLITWIRTGPERARGRLYQRARLARHASPRPGKYRRRNGG